MFPNYEDILSRISEEPSWFDEHAVPRYCQFAPDRSASVYVSEIALAEIACQGCKRLFRVAFSATNLQGKSMAEAIRSRSLHYGDPPNVGCCDVGPVMNSEPRRVLEYWSRHHTKYTEPMPDSSLRQVTNSKEYHRWTRDEALEVDIEPDWVRHP